MELKEFTKQMNHLTRNICQLEESFLLAQGWVRKEQTIKDTARVLVFWSHPERCTSTGQGMAVALEMLRLTNQGVKDVKENHVQREDQAERRDRSRSFRPR